jgi:hypothetical protein
MSTIQQLKTQSLLAKFLFWSGVIMGTVSSVLLLLFVGGNVIDELNKGLITIKEEPLLVLIIFFLLGCVIGLIIAWFRMRSGALITITSSIAAGLTWGFDDLTLLYIILIPLISGILILLSAYQKDDKALS